jgi:putative two-component system response regulator
LEASVEQDVAFAESPCILVVDDLEENVRLLQHFLEPKGYRVQCAYTGQQALGSVEASPPDCILLDLVMPGMDGFEVCTRIKEDPATRHIPIIILTGLSAVEANIRALEAGADDFLIKPIDSILLDARIRNSLRAKLLQDRIIQYQRQLELYNETLEARIRERTAMVERTQQVTIFSLAKLAESRDNETGEHIDRMRCYARELALELGTWPKYENEITGKYVENLYLSSPLHDIGKVGIPDGILLKPGKLTQEEFEIMKAHTVIGGDTLKAADVEAGDNSFLSMGRDIAYYHHEKWNGSGYPFNIGGTEIPLAARIVALGDVYDALTSRRPYKEAFSHEKSRAIILEGRATHFDPDVVDAFLAREERFIEIRRSFHDKGHSRIQELINTLNALNIQAKVASA